VMLIAPFSGWGIRYVLSHRIARDRGTSRSLWASALVQVTATGIVLVGFVALIASFLLKQHIDIVSMVMLGLAELVMLPVAQVASALLLALDRGLPAALAICIVPAGRLVSGIAFWTMVARRTPDVVAVSHLFGSLAGIAVVLLLVARIVGPPAWRERQRMRETIPGGAAYAAGAMVGSAYQEVDKVLMLQLLGAAIVGPYTAAFRVISVFALPVSALASAALPRLFAMHGQPDAPPTLKAVVIASTSYGLVAGMVAVCVAPLMPYIFGSGFSDTTRYLLLLSPWPILFALHQAAAMGLTASHRQHERVLLEGAGFVLIAALNLLLLYPIGAAASVLALLAGEAFMALGCWLCLHRAR